MSKVIYEVGGQQGGISWKGGLGREGGREGGLLPNLSDTSYFDMLIACFIDRRG